MDPAFPLHIHNQNIHNLQPTLPSPSPPKHNNHPAAPPYQHHHPAKSQPYEYEYPLAHSAHQLLPRTQQPPKPTTTTTTTTIRPLHTSRASLLSTYKSLKTLHASLLASLKSIEFENAHWQSPTTTNGSGGPTAAAVGEEMSERLRAQIERVERQARECHRRWEELGEEIERRHVEIAFGGGEEGR